MTNKKKLKLKVMASKTRINKMLKSILRFLSLQEYQRILHLTLASKELDLLDFQEAQLKLEVIPIPKLVILMLALMILMMLETLKKSRKTLKLNKAKTRMLILDYLQEVIKATISEVLVHLLKPEAQDKKKKSLKILSNLVVPQGLDLDLPES